MKTIHHHHTCSDREADLSCLTFGKNAKRMKVARLEMDEEC